MSKAAEVVAEDVPELGHGSWQTALSPLIILHTHLSHSHLSYTSLLLALWRRGETSVSWKPDCLGVAELGA